MFQPLDTRHQRVIELGCVSLTFWDPDLRIICPLIPSSTTNLIVDATIKTPLSMMLSSYTLLLLDGWMHLCTLEPLPPNVSSTKSTRCGVWTRAPGLVWSWPDPGEQRRLSLSLSPVIIKLCPWRWSQCFGYILHFSTLPYLHLCLLLAYLDIFLVETDNLVQLTNTALARWLLPAACLLSEASSTLESFEETIRCCWLMVKVLNLH